MEVAESPGRTQSDVCPGPPGQGLSPSPALKPVCHRPVGHVKVHQTRVTLHRFAETTFQDFVKKNSKSSSMAKVLVVKNKKITWKPAMVERFQQGSCVGLVVQLLPGWRTSGKLRRLGTWINMGFFLLEVKILFTGGRAGKAFFAGNLVAKRFFLSSKY